MLPPITSCITERQLIISITNVLNLIRIGCLGDERVSAQERREDDQGCNAGITLHWTQHWDWTSNLTKLWRQNGQAVPLNVELLQLGQLPDFLRQWDQVIIPEAELNIQKTGSCQNNHSQRGAQQKHTLARSPLFLQGLIFSIHFKVSVAKQERSWSSGSFLQNKPYSCSNWLHSTPTRAAGMNWFSKNLDKLLTICNFVSFPISGGRISKSLSLR